MGRGEGSARRRRERRFEQASVSAAVVSALHHSSDVGPVLYEALRGHKKTTEGEVEEHETHDDLRAQTAPSPGMRLGILPEPGPQRSDHCLRRSAGDTPLLAVPSLAGGDGADDTAVAFLVRQSLLEREEEKRKEEEEVRMVRWRR